MKLDERIRRIIQANVDHGWLYSHQGSFPNCNRTAKRVMAAINRKPRRTKP